MTTFQRLGLATLALGLSACRTPDARTSVEAPDQPAVHLAAAAEEPLAEPAETDARASAPLALEPEILAIPTIARTPEHDRLEALAGRYEVVGAFHPRPDTLARPASGTLVVCWDEDVMSLRATFAGELWGQACTFVSVLGYDPALGVWVETWETSGGAVVRPLAQGYEDEAGRVVTMRSEDGRPVRDELVLDPAEIQRRVYRTGADGREYLGLELVARRVGGF